MGERELIEGREIDMGGVWIEMSWRGVYPVYTSDLSV